MVCALCTVSVHERQNGYRKGVSECQENRGYPLTDLALWVGGAPKSFFGLHPPIYGDARRMDIANVKWGRLLPALKAKWTFIIHPWSVAEGFLR